MSDRLIPWAQLWAMFKTMPDESKINLVHSLDAGEVEGFERFLEGLAPKEQVTVLHNAPNELKRHLYDNGILAPEAVNDLGIKSHTRIRDNRFRELVR